MAINLFEVEIAAWRDGGREILLLVEVQAEGSGYAMAINQTAVDYVKHEVLKPGWSVACNGVKCKGEYPFPWDTKAVRVKA